MKKAVLLPFFFAKINYGKLNTKNIIEESFKQ